MGIAVDTQDENLAKKIVAEYDVLSEEDNFLVIHNMCATKGDTVNRIYFDFAHMVPERSIYRRSIAYGESVVEKAGGNESNCGYTQNQCADGISTNKDVVQYLLEINEELEA